MTLITFEPPDMMRVVAGNSPIADDLNPAVLFSGKYKAGTVEELTGGGPGSGTLYFSRVYSGWPFVVGYYYDGSIYSPFKRVTGEGLSSGAKVPTYWQFNFKVYTTYLVYEVQGLGSGTAKFWVIG